MSEPEETVRCAVCGAQTKDRRAPAAMPANRIGCCAHHKGYFALEEGVTISPSGRRETILSAVWEPL